MTNAQAPMSNAVVGHRDIDGSLGFGHWDFASIISEGDSSCEERLQGFLPRGW
jgi:hypothetical protein